MENQGVGDFSGKAKKDGRDGEGEQQDVLEEELQRSVPQVKRGFENFWINVSFLARARD